MSRDDDDDDRGGGKSSRGGNPKKGGLGTGAIIGIVVGAVLILSCLGCGGCCLLNWDDFKKGFDKGFEEGFKKAQQKK
jgi:hypothetical protein